LVGGFAIGRVDDGTDVSIEDNFFGVKKERAAYSTQQPLQPNFYKLGKFQALYYYTKARAVNSKEVEVFLLVFCRDLKEASMISSALS
jgi:hypothetical protein